MKAKKYTNSSWVEGDYEKEYSTATDTYTTLPAEFQTSGADVENYQVYGASSGVGEETENIIVDIISGVNITQNGVIDPTTADAYECCIAPIENGKSYGLMTSLTENSTVYAFFDTYPTTNGRSYDSQRYVVSGARTVVIAPITGYLVIRGREDYGKEMVIEGSTAPSTFIPKGYKIPISNTSGEQQSNYDLFIGNTKLYEDEYLDYATQKVYKLKEVHKDTVTIDGVVWDILGYDHDEVYDGQGNLASHSVTIQTHTEIDDLPFYGRQALFAFSNGLTAGTYYFTVGAQPWYSADVNKIITFTITQDIPVNGQLALNGFPNASFIDATISSYESPISTSPIETVTMSEAASTPIGTNLGTVNNAINGEINSVQRAYNSSANRWKTSTIRQYLNSDATAGNVWTPQTIWDRPPSWNSTLNGFLYGASEKFVSAIGITKKTTVLNSICDGGGSETTDDKVFLLSRSEVYGESATTEGYAYDYYEEYSDLTSAGTGADSNRIKQYNGSAAGWYLRSCRTNTAANIGYVLSNGSVDSVRGTVGISPAVCIPLDNINNDPYLQSLFLKPIDPPLPFPTFTTYIGENSIDVDTQVQPEKVVLTVKAWREIEGEKYTNGEWSDDNDT